MQSVKIYVIHAGNLPERKVHIDNQLKNLNLSSDFILSWDAPSIDSQVKREWRIAETLSPPQQSCALKHVEALSRISEKPEDSWHLVLEDDVVLSEEFVDALNTTMVEARSFGEIAVVFLGSGGNFYTPRSRRTAGTHLYRAGKGRLADSYMLKPNPARLRLEKIKQIGITKPIDNLYDDIDKELGIEILWYEDPVVEQGSKNGLFKTELETPRHRFLQKYFFLLEKLRRKWLYQLWK
jgi:glycosyl transferase family 25